MATPLPPVDTGRVLAGRYRVGRRLARGGMAEVFIGEDRRLGREVAIKVLRLDKAGDPGIRRRFTSEARAAARLAHPNVVGVYDVGDDGGSPYLIMELVTGGSLAERIAAGPLPQDLVRGIGLDILAGLGAAHQAGILHRDVKPANVLIDERGTAKLTDFGIAKALEPPDGGDLTATAGVIGTPSYLAPERAEGAPAGVASDLWAVGVVLYEALTAAKPFQGSTPLASMLAARQGDFVPLPRRRPDLDPGMAAAVHRALSTDPAGRYATAAAMAEALEGLARWGPPAGAAPALAAAPELDGATNVPPGPDGIRHAPLAPVAGRRTKRALGRLAMWSSLILVVAVVLTWALVDGSGTGRPRPATTVPPHATTTLPPQTTTVPATTTIPPSPPATRNPPPPAHHGGKDDHSDARPGIGDRPD